MFPDRPSGHLRKFISVIKLIIHRYAMLGILDESVYPVQQMGMPEVSQGRISNTAPIPKMAKNRMILDFPISDSI